MAMAKGADIFLQSHKKIGHKDSALGNKIIPNRGQAHLRDKPELFHMPPLSMVGCHMAGPFSLMCSLVLGSA